MLRSFEIERFRTFSHLQIKQLGRVNLVVGRNNVGKSMLLEALRLYGSGGHPAVLANLLLKRDEFLVGAVGPRGLRPKGLSELSALFHDRKPARGEQGALGLRSDENDPFALTLWLRAYRQNQGHPTEPVDSTTAWDDPTLVAAYRVKRGRSSRNLHLNELTAYSEGDNRAEDLVMGSPAFVPPDGLDRRTAARRWDAIKLFGGEERVKEWLGIVAPIEALHDVGNPEDSNERVFVVRLPGSQPVPLNSLGDGMVRIFHIALALESARSVGGPQPDAREQPASPAAADKPAPTRSSPMDMLLIDEVENGIHYTVLPEVWRFIFEVAKLRDVQVFATTHSWDCVEAFQAAAGKDPEADAMLIRLEREGDTHRAVTFSQQELAIVTRDRIEVR